MNTLTLDQLAAETARLKASFGGHYPTSILELQAGTRVVVAVASEVELLTELAADAEKRFEEKIDEYRELEKIAKGQNEVIDQLKALLSEKEEGKTIIEWKLEADEAKAAAEASRRNAMEWHEEVEALRKKKRIQAGWFKYGYELTSIVDDFRLGGILKGESSWAKRMAAEAEALLSKIRSTK